MSPFTDARSASKSLIPLKLPLVVAAVFALKAIAPSLVVTLEPPFITMFLVVMPLSAALPGGDHGHPAALIEWVSIGVPILGQLGQSASATLEPGTSGDSRTLTQLHERLDGLESAVTALQEQQQFIERLLADRPEHPQIPESTEEPEHE